MKLALSQIPLVDEIEANDQKALRMIRAAAQAGAQLICFPELQLTRFFPQCYYSAPQSQHTFPSSAKRIASKGFTPCFLAVPI